MHIFIADRMWNLLMVIRHQRLPTVTITLPKTDTPTSQLVSHEMHVIITSVIVMLLLHALQMTILVYF